MRRFGCPPYERGQERLWLELGRVEGLERVELNGVEHRLAPGVVEVKLGPLELLERNELVLEAELGSAQIAGGDVWGAVALVIEGLGEVGAPPS